MVLRYDQAGRRVVWEVFGGTSLVRAIYSEYDPSTGSLAKEEDRRRGEERTERSYDEGGNVLRETSWRGETLVATLTYSYDGEGRKTSMQRRSEGGIELTTYGYGKDGTLAWEERRERGALRSRTVYTGEDSRYEEVVQSDRLALRVYYEADRKVREEVLRDGKVLRSRIPGEGQ